MAPTSTAWAGARVATAGSTPDARRRDARVSERLAVRGVALTLMRGAEIVAPGELVSGAGTSYRVFTPFHRAWSERLARLGAPVAPPETFPETPAFAPPARLLVDRATIERLKAEGVTAQRGDALAWLRSHPAVPMGRA